MSRSLPTGFEELSGTQVWDQARLATASFDEIVRVLDEPPPDARTLYYRWERQQWEAAQVDFGGDRVDWAERINAPGRASLLALLSCSLSPERAEQALVPFVDAVVSEEQQVFLTTQLADLARHAVLLQRFFSEVVHRRGQTNGGDDRPGDANPELDRISAELLRRSDSVRAHRGPSDDLVAGLLLQGTILTGVLALTATRQVVEHCDKADVLPGLRAGLVTMARDQCRHVSFATHLLQGEASARGEAIQVVVQAAIPRIGAMFEHAAAQTQDFEGIPVDASALTRTAMDQMAARLQDIGLDLPI